MQSEGILFELSFNSELPSTPPRLPASLLKISPSPAQVLSRSIPAATVSRRGTDPLGPKASSVLLRRAADKAVNHAVMDVMHLREQLGRGAVEEVGKSRKTQLRSRKCVPNSGTDAVRPLQSHWVSE